MGWRQIVRSLRRCLAAASETSRLLWRQWLLGWLTCETLSCRRLLRAARQTLVVSSGFPNLLWKEQYSYVRCCIAWPCFRFFGVMAPEASNYLPVHLSSSADLTRN